MIANGQIGQPRDGSGGHSFPSTTDVQHRFRWGFVRLGRDIKRSAREINSKMSNRFARSNRADDGISDITNHTVSCSVSSSNYVQHPSFYETNLTHSARLSLLYHQELSVWRPAENENARDIDRIISSLSHVAANYNRCLVELFMQNSF